MPRKRLRVAACQMHAGEDIELNTARVAEKLKECAAEGVEVASFQEGVLYGYSCREEFWNDLDMERLLRAERKIVRTCKQERIAAVVGSAHMENGVRYNSLLVVDRDGTVRGRYGKIHLAGEEWCSPAQTLPIYRLCGVDCCFLICHDVRYPELVRLPAAAGAQVCFFCSCESPVTAEWKLAAYWAMPVSRATENSIYVVMANAPADMQDLNRSGSSHGESKVIHPDGNLLGEAGIFTEEEVVCDLDLAAADRHIALRAVEDETRVRDWLQAGLALVERSPTGKNGRATAKVRQGRSTKCG
ncbi:MAG: carbon-nitrogen hydrolase family protein [bacterium]|nr:carbon-nitrogen hydrolase family protein [bacterium]